MEQDAAKLRSLLGEILMFPQASTRSAVELHYLLRDFRLESIRIGSWPLSENQDHRLQQMEHRLDMVACNQAVPESVRSEAERALEALGGRQQSKN